MPGCSGFGTTSPPEARRDLSRIHLADGWVALSAISRAEALLCARADDTDVAVIEPDPSALQHRGSRLPRADQGHDCHCVLDCGHPVITLDRGQPIQLEVTVGGLPDVLARPVAVVVWDKTRGAGDVHDVSDTSVRVYAIEQTEPQTAHVAPDICCVRGPPCG